MKARSLASRDGVAASRSEGYRRSAMDDSLDHDPASRSRRVRLALCLSGGGYRAALFHLGALWRLHELGLLAQVRRISSVSGGSILAAFLAERLVRAAAGADPLAYARWCATLDFRAALAEPFAAVVRHDIRTLPALLCALPNLVRHRYGSGFLARSYRRLLGARSLAELPRVPDLVFCATNLRFGVNFEFSRTRVGDYQTGYLRGDAEGPQPHDIAIATAVAASSCFPPVFGPLRLRTEGMRWTHGGYRGVDRDRLVERVDLTDGGVYDNLAMEPVIKHADVVLVSDGGSPFPFEPGRNLASKLARYGAVMGNQANALRKRLFAELRRSGQIDGALWSLTRPLRDAHFGYSPELVQSCLARVRTDLDRFSRAEFEILVDHGYGACEAALAQQPQLLHGAPEVEAALPYSRWADEGVVEQALALSHRRFSPTRWWRGLREGPRR
jgi:NTE family protein